MMNFQNQRKRNRHLQICSYEIWEIIDFIEVYMEGYMTIKQAAEKWNITTRRIQFLCSSGRIDGATKFGRDWAIPADAAKPEDKRVTTGEYRNWRKKKS